MFTGEFNYSIDDKGRIVIPPKFRENLGSIFHITRSLDNCLMIYDQNNWNVLEEKVSKLPFTDKRARDLRRFILGSSHQIEIDKQGRILIPQSLREACELQNEVTFVGIGNSIEVWNQSYFNEIINKDKKEIAESMEGLGI